MLEQKIEAEADVTVDKIADSCGEVVVGCADVAGIVGEVIASSARLRIEHEELANVVAELDTDQRKVSEASDEARLLSERAIERLGQGTAQIEASLGRITELLDLVEALSVHVSGFAAAMEQVKRSSQDIGQIAETTNILALNATIEAMRAGEAGATFAVVAEEVKSLANETRRSTEEISQTIDNLAFEANQVIDRIEAGTKASTEAKASVGSIEQTISGVAELVEEVDRQNDQIARATGTISAHVGRVHDVLENFQEASKQDEQRLTGVRSQVGELEDRASQMFDHIVHAGLSPQDSAMVAKAQEAAAEAKRIVEEALADGSLSTAQLFDDDYREVEGTDPVLYRTSLTKWADDNWRPLLDRVKASHPKIIATVCDDRNGWLPTHTSDRCQKPTGDYKTDLQFSRNGRIIVTPFDKWVKKSTKPYSMAVYRHENDGDHFQSVRLVSVPMYFNGKRWGEYEISYVA